jgi:adenosylmethionine-8-amino-7-oxononanoate aminotransferase
MKESATKSIHDPTVMATAVPVTAALHSLKILATDKYCKDERSRDDWHKLLQSALAKVIDLAKTGKENILSLSSLDFLP